MVITQPTIDDFSDTTVMRVIRKIVNYICNDLVDGINNNDIVSGQFSVQGNQLSGTLTKGDGTTINIPAATLPGGGGGGSDNPYPTAVSMTLSGTTLNFSMTMSSGPPITGSVNLAPILEGYATKTEVTGIGVTSEGNNVSVNGKTATIVKSVSGQVTDGNLKITVNGVESGDIPLSEPESTINISMGITYNGNIANTTSVHAIRINPQDRSFAICGDTVLFSFNNMIFNETFSFEDLGNVNVYAQIYTADIKNTILANEHLNYFPKFKNTVSSFIGIVVNQIRRTENICTIVDNITLTIDENGHISDITGIPDNVYVPDEYQDYSFYFLDRITAVKLGIVN